MRKLFYSCLTLILLTVATSNLSARPVKLPPPPGPTSTLPITFWLSVITSGLL